MEVYLTMTDYDSPSEGLISKTLCLTLNTFGLNLICINLPLAINIKEKFSLLRDCTDIWIKWEETFMDENIYVYLRFHR